MLAQKNLGVQPSSCDPPVLASMPLPLFQAPTPTCDLGSLDLKLHLQPSLHIVTAIESEHAPNAITPILFPLEGPSSSYPHNDILSLLRHSKSLSSVVFSLPKLRPHLPLCTRYTEHIIMHGISGYHASFTGTFISHDKEAP